MSYQKLKAGEELPKSKYKGVSCCITGPEGKYINFRAQIVINGKRQYSNHQTEIEAAKRYDMYLIRAGKDPVNILKPK
tara:strand:+ start:2437 stop:2670 length:234 start_codon:yes stop_codon:yes gene_type:complete